MLNKNPALQLTHKCGMVVKVEYYRTWHKTLQRAIRIMRARLYAREKGLEKLEKSDLTSIELNEIRFGQFAAVVEIGGQKYTIHESRAIRILPANADDETA